MKNDPDLVRYDLKVTGLTIHCACLDETLNR